MLWLRERVLFSGLGILILLFHFPSLFHSFTLKGGAG
jgi:hypothetical protein